MFIHPKQQLTKRTGELFRQVSGASNGAAVYSKKNAFAAACIQVAQIALRKADEVTKKVPVPAVVRKHLSKKDMAFIAAAYAIPLPGTALFAAAIVGSNHGCRHLRSRLKPRLTVNASNG
jgi:hypothetical protein